MPGFDATGPMGEGPMTGGGRGRCNPRGAFYARGGFGMGRGFRQGFGRGFGFGRGYGRGFGWRGFYPAGGRWYGPAYGRPYAMSEMDEVTMLKDEADALNNELGIINRRIEELEGKVSKQD